MSAKPAKAKQQRETATTAAVIPDSNSGNQRNQRADIIAASIEYADVDVRTQEDLWVYRTYRTPIKPTDTKLDPPEIWIVAGTYDVAIHTVEQRTWLKNGFGGALFAEEELAEILD